MYLEDVEFVSEVSKLSSEFDLLERKVESMREALLIAKLELRLSERLCNNNNDVSDEENLSKLAILSKSNGNANFNQLQNGMFH